MILTGYSYYQNIPAHQSQCSNVCKTFRADIPPASSVTKKMENTVTIATEDVDFMDFTDTNPENNWYQFYTNFKWIGTKWKDYRRLVLSFDIDFVK